MQMTDGLTRIEKILERIVVVEERSKHSSEDIRDFEQRIADIEKIILKQESKIEYIYLIAGSVIGFLGVAIPIIYEILK